MIISSSSIRVDRFTRVVRDLLLAAGQGKRNATGHTHSHTTVEQTTHTSTERATAQRRLIVEVVVAAPKLPPSAALLLSSLLPTNR